LEEKGNHDENDDFDAHCVFHDMQVHGSSYFFASIFFYASISSWRFCGIEVWVNAREQSGFTICHSYDLLLLSF
jgi:hypothetical protein